MKKAIPKKNLDETTRNRISKLQWKKGTKEADENVSAFIVDVLFGEDWVRERYDKMNEDERKLFNRFFEYALNSLAGQDYDQFLQKIQPLLNESTRQNIEEVQHVAIANAIDKLTKEKNRFPARCEIVSETGYSHDKVNKSLATYQGSVIHKGREEELVVMREKMITMCYQHGVRGDMKAARLFFEMTSKEKNEAPYRKNEQNNFIQINGYTITTEQIKLLPEEKQIQIRDILLQVKGSFNTN